MTIREFFRTIWVGKFVVLAAIVIAVGGALVYAKGKATVYQATVVVRLQSTEVPGTGGGGEGEEGGGGGGSAITVQTDFKDVLSDEVIEPAAAELGEDPDVLRDSISASPALDGSTAMWVMADVDDPDLAIARAEAVATQYAQEFLVEARDDQIAELDKELASASTAADLVPRDGNGNAVGSAAQAQLSVFEGRIQTLTTQKSNLELLDPPAEITDPTDFAPLGMSASIVMAAAGLAGLVIGIGIAFARRGLDTRVRSSAEAASLAGTPVLAELSGVGTAVKDFDRTGGLPVAGRTATPYTESIRELRTAVQVPVGAGGYAVVAVTAADPHAPRAFITANLAASFALSGRATVVVPGDLRQPQLAEMLPSPDGRRDENGVLRPTRIPNLSVLPVYDETLDPADFLATDAVREMIFAQRENAAVIVIDSPPVLAAADATIVGGYAQGVVLVATAGRTDRAVLREAAERLRANNVPIVGLALAGVERDKRMLYASTYGESKADAPVAVDASTPMPSPSRPPAQIPVPTAGPGVEAVLAPLEGAPVLDEPVPAREVPPPVAEEEPVAPAAEAPVAVPPVLDEPATAEPGADAVEPPPWMAIEAFGAHGPQEGASLSPNFFAPVGSASDEEPGDDGTPEPAAPEGSAPDPDLTVGSTELERSSILYRGPVATPTVEDERSPLRDPIPEPPRVDVLPVPEPGTPPSDPLETVPGPALVEPLPESIAPVSVEPLPAPPTPIEPAPSRTDPGPPPSVPEHLETSEAKDTETRAIPVVVPKMLGGQPHRPRPKRPIRPPSAGPARRR